MAHEAADVALSELCDRLDDFRGQTSFTTWAAKFGIVAAAVTSRRRAWATRDLPESSAAETLARMTGRSRGQREIAVVVAAIDALPADERRILIALALNGVPIDVLAEREGTTRDALYERLQSARRALRARVGGPDFSA